MSISEILGKIYAFYFDHLYWRIIERKGGTFLDQKLQKLLLESEKEIRERLSELEEAEEKCEKISEKEWDNLIVLDACRHDIYEEVTGKNTDYRISCSSISEEYVSNNFSEGDWKDTVYINGNPYLSDKELKRLTGREDIFFEKWDTFDEKWDEELTTVPPKAIVEDAVTAENLFPEKRKIIHFMQPHARFLYDEGDKARKNSDYELNIANTTDPDPQKIREAYKENLRIVLKHVNELVENLEGMTVITADHGELLGENKLYSHFPETNNEYLRKVPWDTRKGS